ncbi:MAG: YaeQ family protein [Pseudomonadota bacterium]|nr:YaeQ family protein [Pseudomonadota bacterium]
MALKATIYKCDLNIADMDQHYYAEHALTVAQHPSETAERLLVRLLSFARFARDTPEFTKDLFETDLPALWSRDLTGTVTLWIELGQPDESKIRKACNRVDQVVVVSYATSTDIWWKSLDSKVARMDNLTVLQLPWPTLQTLAAQINRGMQMQVNIQDGDWSVALDGDPVDLDWITLKHSKMAS